MKEIVGNRKRISAKAKLGIASQALKENGPIWLGTFTLYYAAAGLAEWAFTRMHAMRLSRGLPGLNSATLNRQIWEEWDWEQGGEEWTISPDWKDSVVRDVLKTSLKPGGTIVEIGPGAGRWTEHLIALGDELIGVDISQTCVDLCSKKFAGNPARFVKTTGADLPGVAAGSVHSLWSFDVFVHINSPEVTRYATEFARVMAPGARGVIHHGNAAGRNGGWRSDMDGDKLRAILVKEGFTVVKQFGEWEDSATGVKHKAGLYDDAITVFEKPAAAL